MDYNILKAWCEANTDPEFQVETCSLTSEFLVLHGKKRLDLAFNRSKGDPFPFFRKGMNAPADASIIWSQLHFARLQGIEIMEADRIITLRLTTEDIYQQVNHYQIILECTPGHPNAILCREKSGELIIQDALEKYGYADNPQRQVLPNLVYTPPNTAYSPSFREISLPLVLKDLSGTEIPFPSINDYLQGYYTHILVARIAQEESRRQNSYWESELKKTKKKLSSQQADLANAEKAELWFSYAETIKYNLHQIKPGQESLKAINYHDPEMPEIEIPLLNDRSPQDNLKHYIKRYHKARKGLEIIKEHLLSTNETLKRLEDILARIRSGESIPPLSGKKESGNAFQNPLDILDKLLRVRLNPDFEIVIGRKAKENDFITTKLGRPHDWWFHTRIYHGSHILLRCLAKKDPDPELIRRCCSLAAWYSKAKFSSNVPVDYTQIRYVRKPRKSAPGYVIYTNHQTVYAEPADIRQLKAELGL